MQCLPAVSRVFELPPCLAAFSDIVYREGCPSIRPRAIYSGVGRVLEKVIQRSNHANTRLPARLEDIEVSYPIAGPSIADTPTSPAYKEWPGRETQQSQQQR